VRRRIGKLIRRGDVALYPAPPSLAPIKRGGGRRSADGMLQQKKIRGRKRVKKYPPPDDSGARD